MTLGVRVAACCMFQMYVNICYSSAVVSSYDVHEEVDACYDRGAPRFFSLAQAPQFWCLRPLPQTDLEKKKKTAMILPDEKSHGLVGKRLVLTTIAPPKTSVFL